MVLKIRNKDAELKRQGAIDGPSLGMAISLGSIIILSMVAVALLAVAIF